MRSKREIDRLTEKALAMKFPEAVHWSFYDFQTHLNEVLDENGLGGDWTYVPRARAFATTWEEKTLINDFLVVITGRASLHLEGETLADEIERLIGFRATFTERAQAMFRAATTADQEWANPHRPI
jgi:hypothetical protein